MNELFNIIKFVLWGDKTAINGLVINENLFEELKSHGILALTVPILGYLPPELYEKWTRAIIAQISSNLRNQYLQSRIPISVPYIILKGTSASQYYLHPEYRSLGDIDLMTSREDFETANQELIDAGFVIVDNREREVKFVKNGIIVELHRYFASLNDPGQAKYLDDLIIDNINPSHVLPDLVNGIVLLEHISQHLENGLGLRQIIDWMMFVDKRLSDKEWPAFRILADNISLEILAITVTRMCELYLGLPERKWSSKADPSLCEILMDYILSSGNFGNKWVDEINAGTRAFVRMRSLKVFFFYLQDYGLANWKSAQKYSILRPFAWIYQAVRYLRKGFDQKGDLVQEYRAARNRNDMFDALGVKQKTKGLAVYRNGKYCKL